MWACGAVVRSAFASTEGLVSLTICSQKSTPTRLSWNRLWSNMYSAASPRLMIHSARCGGRTPNAMFWAYTAHVAWLSPQMPQMRLVMKWASRGSLPRMNTLYPRKMDEVLWHSTTRRSAKSILVWMPRLPTIRVTGSQDISTSCDGLASLPIGVTRSPSGRG